MLRYLYDPNSSQTADGVYVVAPASGVGRFLREDVETQEFWYVDSATGSDFNDGRTPATALKTLAELAIRWNAKIFAPTLATVTVQLTGSFPTEYLVLDNAVFPGPTNIVVRGTMTQVASGSITSYTPWNGTVTQRGAVTDTAQNFAPHVNRRIRITTGVVTGAVSAIGSTGTTTATANVGQFCSDIPATVNPAIGDSYSVETFDTVCAGYSIHLPGQAMLRVKDIDFTASAAPVARCEAVVGGTQTRALFFGCRLNAPTSMLVEGKARYAGCIFEGGLFTFSNGNHNVLNSCVFGGTGAVLGLQVNFCTVLSQAIMHDGNGLRNATLFIGNGTYFESIGGTGNFAHAFFGCQNGAASALAFVEDCGRWVLSNAQARFVGNTNSTVSALQVRNGSGLNYVTLPTAQGGTPNNDVVLASQPAVPWSVIATQPNNAFVNVRQ